jgi:hypothetical protein
MIRLLGFLVGSAVSIGAILLILGVPEFEIANPQLDKHRFDEALENLREKQRELAMSASDAEVLALQVPPLPDGDAAAVTESAIVETVDVAGETPPMLSELQAPEEFKTLPFEQQWHTFWNPFRSEIAARGFVSQLERVTGLDYRVVKVKSGVYEVAFAYEGDVERQARLAQIEAATGLDLPGS